MAPCRLCGQERPLVKAHAVPEAFFRAISRSDASGAPIIVSNKPLEPTKRTPIGVYDTRILCAECEKRFGHWDDYAASVLINELDSGMQALSAGGEVLAFHRSSVDYARLKLFFIALLWRASVSTMPFYRNVRLGPYEERARQMILSGQPGEVNEFGVVMARRIASPHMEAYANSMISPFREKLDGVNFVRLYLGRVVSYVKVDRRPMQSPFDEVVLRPGRPLVMLAQEFDQGRDLDAMRKIVRMNSGL
jgi:hypothetical protein